MGSVDAFIFFIFVIFQITNKGVWKTLGLRSNNKDACLKNSLLELAATCVYLCMFFCRTQL